MVVLGLVIVAIRNNSIESALTQERASVDDPMSKAAFRDSASTQEASQQFVLENIGLEEIQPHLDRLISGKRSIIANLGLLIISVIIFIRLGLLYRPLSTIMIVAAVILIHELGHFIGMKAFGYSNVRIFFIPLFGAATSGIETNPSGSKKAIVSLSGPLPGIAIGIILAVLYFVTENERLVQPAWIFLFINAFNLLPFFPLDGGRFVESLFSMKSFALEMVFKTISIMGLAAAWYLIGPGRFAPGLIALFVILLISLQGSFRIASAARKVACQISITHDLRPNQIPREYLSAIYKVLKPKLGFGASSKVAAKLIYSVWQRLLNKPPARKAITGFVILYLFSLTVAFSAPIILKSAIMTVHVRKEFKLKSPPMQWRQNAR
jgi:Zn-dependent protease